jgi:hypothetical protein
VVRAVTQGDPNNGIDFHMEFMAFFSTFNDHLQDRRRPTIEPKDFIGAVQHPPRFKVGKIFVARSFSSTQFIGSQVNLQQFSNAINLFDGHGVYGVRRGSGRSTGGVGKKKTRPFSTNSAVEGKKEKAVQHKQCTNGKKSNRKIEATGWLLLNETILTPCR